MPTGDGRDPQGVDADDKQVHSVSLNCSSVRNWWFKFVFYLRKKFISEKKLIGHGHPVKDWLPKAQEPKPTQPQGKGRGRQPLPLKEEERERKMSRMWTPPSRKRPQGGDADRGWPRIPREARPQGGEAPGRRGPRETRPLGGDTNRGSPGRQNSLGRDTVRLSSLWLIFFLAIVPS